MGIETGTCRGRGACEAGAALLAGLCLFLLGVAPSGQSGARAAPETADVPGTARAAESIALQRSASRPAGFSEFPLPSPGSSPVQIELDGLGGVWATEQDGNRIARLDPLSGQWEEYSIPTPDSQPWGLVLDGAGHLWVAEQAGNRIARFDTVQRVWVEEHQVPTPASRPYDLVVGPFGRIWFTESAGRKLGELDPITGAIVEHDPLSQPDPVEVDQPGSIASHDLDVWFTDPERDQLVRFYAYLGRFYRFWPPTAGCGPQDVAVSPEGDVWITEGKGDKVALMSWSTNGDWYEYEVASEGSEPYGITLTGYEVWFTERLGDRLGHWSGPWLPAEHSLPSPGSQPTDVAVDSQGCVWYAAPGSNALGRMCLEYVHSTYLPVLAWEAAKP